MNARLIYFVSGVDEEAILIDTTGSSNVDLERDYDMTIKEIVPLSRATDFSLWPADNLLVPK